MDLPAFWIGILGFIGAMSVLTLLYAEHKNRRKDTAGTQRYLRIVRENWDQFSRQTSLGLVLIAFSVVMEIDRSVQYWAAFLLFLSQVAQGGSWSKTLYSRVMSGIGIVLYVVSIATISITLIARSELF